MDERQKIKYFKQRYNDQKDHRAYTVKDASLINKGKNTFRSDKLDPDTNLPLGVGFDDVIKAKSVRGLTITQGNETYCSDLMDELIENLGYLDYRDFLACNKYLLEAKRTEVYRNKAKINFLAYAVKGLKSKRQQELAKKWHMQKGAKDFTGDMDEIKLKDLFAEDKSFEDQFEREIGFAKENDTFIRNEEEDLLEQFKGLVDLKTGEIPEEVDSDFDEVLSDDELEYLRLEYLENKNE